eukprot:CAMPEP_0182476934 /NCGR_PEP_ID=MMETSP1319-20130603/30038_1 /TAXON_ID=172717 /ORGANISM="Bolidomonas pacifica, Strain RCC208" /LENGTH=36 /DNA_ID= /DNA_START= /DNA_END= /DNA_ORIENTATION=
MTSLCKLRVVLFPESASADGLYSWGECRVQQTSCCR